jgi:UDP-N-acetylglucosamine 3-dehydrogenase
VETEIAILDENATGTSSMALKRGRGRTSFSKEVNLGLIGCGSIAEESHLPAIARNPSLNLVAVADVNETKAKAMAAEYHVDHYQDYHALLDNDKLDAVDVCVPTKYHSKIVVDAAKAGKHVICEKPMALSLREADDMIHACSKHGMKLMIAHSRRFIPRNSLVKRSIEKGQIGRPIWACQISRRHKESGESPAWTRDPRMTYGPIIEGGVHDADLLRWFFEDEVVGVNGIATPSRIRFSDQIFAALRFRQGGVASFEVSIVLPRKFAQYTTLNVVGTKGSINSADSRMNRVVLGTKHGTVYPLAYEDLLAVSSAYELEIDGFADSILCDTQPPVTGSDGRAALEIVLALMRSIKSRRTVRLPLEA